MKILFVGNGDDSKGSAQCLLELAAMLKEKYKYDIVVVNPFYNRLNEKCDELGLENYSLGYQEMICKKDHSGIIFALKFFAKYIRYKICNFIAMNRFKRMDFSNVDVIHSNTTAVDFGAKLARKLNKPHIWHIREFGKEDFNFHYFHRNLPHYINSNSDRIIAISRTIYKSWASRGIDEKKFIHIYDGVVGKNYIDKTRTSKKKSEKVRIAFCGGISPTKGQYQLIQALGELTPEKKNSVYADFYGSGKEQYLNELIELANKCGVIDLISFKGYVTNIQDVLTNYDVGVVCSHSEGFGRITSEYMLSGMCVVASDSGANPEVLRDEKYGLLYKGGDPKSLAEKLEFLIDNRELIQVYGSKSREYALSNYILEGNIHRITEVYLDALNED